MPGRQLTQAEYALQKTVESFGNLLLQLEELLLTHTYREVFLFCQLGNVGCLVLRYLNTHVLPFEEYSKDLLIDEEA